MNPLTALAESKKTLRSLQLVKKANPSQALGGIIIPDQGSHSSIINTGTDPDRLILNGWKANVFAYTCLDRLAANSSQAFWRVERRTGDGENDFEPDPSDWRQQVLNYPMGNDMSAQEMFYYFFLWLGAKGNGLLRKILGGEHGVVGLIPMTPKNVVPVPNKPEWCSGYNIMEDGKIIWNYPSEEIIHARLPDPTDPFWGFGMLEAAFPYIESDNFSRKLRSDTYKSGGVPVAAIIDEELSAASVDAEAVALQAAFRRNAINKLPMLMGGKKQIVEFGFSASDMEISSDREFTRDEIVLAFGMHPSMFSNAAATYDNQDAAIRYMYENGVARLLAAARDALNISLLTDEEREDDGVYINFDLSQIPFFRRQRESKFALLGTAMDNGVTWNEGTRLLDLGLPEDKEGGDTRLTQGGRILLSEAAAGVASSDMAASTAVPAGQPGPDDLGNDLPQAQDIQVTTDAVLNGAQITAATAIVTAVAAGELPRDAGIGQLMVLFNLESSQAEIMMGSAGKGFVAASVSNQPPPVVPDATPAE